MQLSKPVLYSGLAAAGVTYLLAVPNQYKIPCFFHATTGYLCPGCGLTRAALAVLRGDIPAAFNFNQLVFFLPVFLAALYFAKKSKYAKTLTLLLVIIGGVATLGFFLIRNNFI